MGTTEALETIEVNGEKRQVKALDADLSGSSFMDVNLSVSTFENVNFAGAKIEDANLSGWNVRNASLAGWKVESADLRGAAITDCLTAGMTIDGVAVEEMMAAYRALTATCGGAGAR